MQVHSRGNLQANDLLDIVDFIKNEEKYTGRINELKAKEASVMEKLKIANTIEKALALGERNRLIEEKLAKDRGILEQEWKDKKKELEAEYIKKQETLALKISTAASKIASLDKARAELELEKEELAKQQHQLQNGYTALNKREMELHVRAEKLAYQFTRIREVIES